MHQQTYKPNTKALVQPKFAPQKFQPKNRSPVRQDKILREPTYIQDPQPQKVYAVPLQTTTEQPQYYQP
jgi:hypothetical protein